MKVLMTGMTAQQANPASTRRGENFTGLLVRALRQRDHEVDWHNPTVNASLKDLNGYDSVIVGVAPITGLGSNRAYGALSTIQLLWDSPRLTLLVDAPDPAKIQGSLNAIRKRPENLLKEFFSYRLEYEEATRDWNAGRLHEAVELLDDSPWPATIAPMLPWQRTVSQVRGLLQPSADVHLVNLDHLLLGDLPQRPPATASRHDVWAYEPSGDARWLRTQNVTWETGSIARNVRIGADKVAVEQLRSVSGCLIAPTRTGTWWSTRYAQALSQGAPVFSDWTETSILGPEWSQLPAHVELMSPQQRAALHNAQLERYVACLPNAGHQLDQLETALTEGRMEGR